MTEKNFDIELDSTIIPKQGDFVVFGDKHIYFLARVGHVGEHDGLKFISMDDGNRVSDSLSISNTISILEKDHGRMRIVKQANTSLIF